MSSRQQEIKEQVLYWYCPHCEDTLETKTRLKPRECRCKNQDFKLSEENDKDSVLYLQALFGINKTEGRELIANRLINKHHFKSVLSSNGQEIYVYQKGVYSETGHELINYLTEKILQDQATNTHLAEVTNKIARKTMIERKELENKNPHLICVKNGILNLETKELFPHDHKFIFLTQIPVEWNPNAKCPGIKTFLNEVLAGPDIPVFLEYAGYCLYQKYNYKKAMLLLGPRDTGKSTVVNLLTGLLGEKNVSGESLHKIIKDKFSAVNLYQKLSNIYDDLSTKDFGDAGTFKIATGGGWITGEQKFKTPFLFKNHAKLFFATNEVALPESVDEAYYSRWLVLRMDRQFSEGEKETNKSLIDSLLTKEELEGLLVLVVKSLSRVLKNQRFSYFKTPAEVKDLMLLSGDSVSAFIQEALVVEPEEVTTVDEAFRSFVKYCRDNGRGAVTKIKFSKKVRSLRHQISECRKDKKVAWKNIGIIEKFKVNIVHEKKKGLLTESVIENVKRIE